jgi:hypothetical protein
MYSTQNVLYTKCTLHKMYCTQNILYTKCTLHKMYSTQNVLYTKCTVHKTLAVMFSATFFTEIFLIVGIIQRDIIVNAYLSSCKVPFILVKLLLSSDFPERLTKNTQMSNLRNYVEWELSRRRRRDGRTDRHEEASSSFSQTCEKLLATDESVDRSVIPEIPCRL